MRLKLPVPHCVRQGAERAYGLRFGQAPKGSAPNALVEIPSFNLGGGREYLAQRQVGEGCGIGIGFDRIGLTNLSPRCLTGKARLPIRSEEHTSELQSLMRNSYAVFCLKKKKQLLICNPIPTT